MKIEEEQNEDKTGSLCKVRIQGPYEKHRCLRCHTCTKICSQLIIDLPKDVVEKLQKGDNMWVSRDSTHDVFDLFYLYRGGIVFHEKPTENKRESYKHYLARVPGVIDFKLDRLALKIAMAKECYRRDLGVSLLAWRNLQRFCKDTGLGK